MSAPVQTVGGAICGGIRAFCPPLMVFRPKAPSPEFAASETAAELTVGFGAMLFGGKPPMSSGTTGANGSMALASIGVDTQVRVLVGAGGMMTRGSGPPPKNAPPTKEEPAAKAPDEKSSPRTQDYVNNNPKATESEVGIGKSLNKLAQEGKLGDVGRVEGAAEVKGVRSGDYRFVNSDGVKVSADLYQPLSGNPDNIASNIIEKSGQAQTVVVELGAGNSGKITMEQAAEMAQGVVNTPGHSVSRVIVFKNGGVVMNVSR